MEDKQIVDLYWERSETALSETDKKYGRYCHYIAFNILHSHEDSEECVYDTYFNAWNGIPPNRPTILKTFLGKLVRNLALNKYKNLTAEKRGKGQIPLVIDELHECLPTAKSVENIVDDIALVDVLNRFLESLSSEKRKIFMRRYWYMSTIKEIADDYCLTESKVKMILLRSRNDLKKLLQKEDIVI